MATWIKKLPTSNAFSSKVQILLPSPTPKLFNEHLKLQTVLSNYATKMI